MSDPEPLTALTIGRSAGLLVGEVCMCGGKRNRRTWRKPGDLRNRHAGDCPAVTALSRLVGVIEEALRAALEGVPHDPE